MRALGLGADEAYLDGVRVVSGPDGQGAARDERREIILRVLMFFLGLGGFAVLWLLQFRLWATVAVVVGLLIIDEVLERLVRGAWTWNRSTND
jgi:hypothetical protein